MADGAVRARISTEMVRLGESERIQDIRRRFQRAMADQFRSVVEQATGEETEAQD
jgi:hypothetical protein